MMKKIFLFLTVSLAPALTGCFPEKTDLPQDGFRLEVEKIAEQNNLVIHRSNLYLGEEQLIRFSVDGKTAGVLFTPFQEVEPNQCSLLLVANLVDQPEVRLVSWRFELKSGGQSAGGGHNYLLATQQELKDVVDLEIPVGEYPLGSELRLGTVNGQPMRLVVTDPPPSK